MKTYFCLRRRFSSGAFTLVLDYSLEEVSDTLALNRSDPTPKEFLDKFTYAKSYDSKLEDMLANSLGWHILSGRLSKIIQECKNAKDVELLPLPKNAVHLDPRLEEYRVLGVKKEVKCVNYSESDILWDSDRRHIVSFRECVLHEHDIPECLDIFQMAEYPVMPVISSDLAKRISELHPTGLAFQKVRAA